jgi:hypothetical protein
MLRLLRSGTGTDLPFAAIQRVLQAMQPAYVLLTHCGSREHQQHTQHDCTD